MKYYTTLLWIAFILAVVSLIVGVIAKVSGFLVFGLYPIAYLRFTDICLKGAIALSLVEISLRIVKKE